MIQEQMGNGVLPIDRVSTNFPNAYYLQVSKINNLDFNTHNSYSIISSRLQAKEVSIIKICFKRMFWL